MSHKNLDRR